MNAIQIEATWTELEDAWFLLERDRAEVDLADWATVMEFIPYVGSHEGDDMYWMWDDQMEPYMDEAAHLGIDWSEPAFVDFLQQNYPDLTPTFTVVV